MAVPAHNTQPEAEGTNQPQQKPRVLSVQTTSSRDTASGYVNAPQRARRVANEQPVDDDDPDESEDRYVPSSTNRNTSEVTEQRGSKILRDAKAIRAAAESGRSTFKSFKKKTKAIQVSWLIAGIVMPFYPIQLFFGFLQFGGVGLELVGENLFWGWGASLIPGEWVFATGFLATVLFALIIMFVAVFFYSARGVAWWRGFGIPMFILITTLYFVPILNIFPWILAWMVTVVYAQK